LGCAGRLSLAELTDLSAHLAGALALAEVTPRVRAAIVASRPAELAARLESLRGSLDHEGGDGEGIPDRGRLDPRAGGVLGRSRGRGWFGVGGGAGPSPGPGGGSSSPAGGRGGAGRGGPGAAGSRRWRTSMRARACRRRAILIPISARPPWRSRRSSWPAWRR